MYRTEELAALAAAVQQELDRREAEALKGSLRAFIEKFWHVVEPRIEFKFNWHLQVIIDHLEAITRGELDKVIFNVPPGTSKSTIVSVMWPAWELAKDPSMRIFGASYSEPLAIRDAGLCRRILADAEYQRLFGLAIRRGGDQKTKYETTAGGWRMATTVNGRGTGEHPNRIIIDDPHNVKQSESDVERQQALDWFDGTMASRGVMHSAATVIIMQRLHEKDLTGHVMLSEDYVGWVHVIIPMEYEPNREPVKRQQNPLRWKDPRTKKDELLWPDVFTQAKVNGLKRRLGTYRAAGQLQQRPSPPGGGIFKIECFQLWPANKPWPIFTYILQSYDTAFTDDNENNDPTALSVWGVFGYVDEKRQPRTGAMLLDCWEEWLEYPQLRKRMITDYRQEYGGNPDDPANQPRRPDRVLIEDKASGKSLIQDLRGQARIPVVPFNPGHSSKVARAHEAAPHLEAGNFWIPESSVEKGKIIKWARPFTHHLEVFPNGAHFDWADTFSQATRFLAKTGHLTLDAVLDDPETERDYTKKRRNPYSS